MMRNGIKIVCCVLSFFIFTNCINAISLKDYRIQYEKDLAKYNSSNNKQNEVKNKINLSLIHI